MFEQTRSARNVCTLWRHVTVLLAAVIVASIPFALSAAQRFVPYEYVTGDTLDLPRLSVIGRRVFRNPEEWVMGQSEHFIVFAHERHELQNAVDEAENALKRAGEWFNLDTEEMPTALLVFLQDGATWDKLMKGFGLRRDGLSMQLGRELYFKDAPGVVRRPERISHEVIQLALNQAFAPRIPLWLDEGIACHFGWVCAVEMYNTREIAISREQPAFPAEDLFPMEELLATRKYPEDPYRARVFYRQSEALAAVMASRLDRSDFARFIHTICAADVINVETFLGAAGLSEDDWDDIVLQVRNDCTQGADLEP